MTPRQVGPFRIERLLGEGGIGRVYEALDEDLGRRVALKALRPELSHDRGFVDRFRAEAASLARLHHPHVTTLYSLHRDGADLYMVMELVRGHTLEDAARQLDGFSPEAVRAVAAQACDGLGYAHRMGVIHRDIKPSNLMLTEQGQLKIMDFGIARISGSQRMTRAGSIVGTLAYMPPEQIRGADNDQRSDIYSLGCVLYEMICGAPPFAADTEYELIQAQINATPLAPHERGRTVDPAFEATLLRALAKSPENRFESTAEFASALGCRNLERDAAEIARDAIVSQLGSRIAQPTRVMALPTAAKPPAPAAVPVRPKRVLPLPFILLAGLACVLVAGVTFAVLDTPSDTVSPAVVAGPTAPTTTPAVTAGLSVPRSENLLPPPDAGAEAAASTAQSSQPECSMDSASGSVRGAVTSLSDDGWPQIEGNTIDLYGVQTVDAAHRPDLQTWIGNKGGDLMCCTMPQGGHRCLTETTHQDVSLFILMNGLAQAAQGAPQRYVDAQQMARSAQRGVWR